MKSATTKMKMNPWQFQLPWRCSVVIEHAQGFTGSHWMPPSGKCLCPIAPVAAMVNKFVETTQNTIKTQLLASNYGTFRLLVVCEYFIPQNKPSTQHIDATSFV
jgi:hypothetical protein